MASSPLFLTNESSKLSDGVTNLNSDDTNSDLDGDGYTYAVEEECGSDPSDSTSIPNDLDSDGTCDILDDDIDGDSWSNDDELTCGSDPTKASSIPVDGDEDSVCDEMDAFPDNGLEWIDSDNDGIGDNRDNDDDNDGVDDDYDVFQDYPCAATDTDNDGFPDILLSINCRDILQEDWDDDNDGVFDSRDAFPLDACFAFDTDNDGLPDDVLPGGECDPTIGTDSDDDNDGWADIADAFPLNPREWADQDFDGIGNNEDINDDGDGWSDLFEDLCETDPLSPTSYPLDTDGDGLCDLLDPDDDNDGIPDGQDSEPLSAAGSWQWATGAGDLVEINDMVMDSNGDILVTGSYRGQTSLGSLTLEQHNKEDAFVAKMDNQGNWLWATTTSAQPKLCANSGQGAQYTVNSASVAVQEFTYTGLVGYHILDSNLPFDWLQVENILPNTQYDATQNFTSGDLVFDNRTSPPTFIGVIQTVGVDFIQFTENLYHYAETVPTSGGSNYGMELVKFDFMLTSYDSSLSVSIGNGDFQKKIWEDSFAVSNAIAVDGNGDAYITGMFDGFIEFEKTGFNDVIKSYNVREEGEWLKDRWYIDNDYSFWERNFNAYPCGAPQNYTLTGTDMFVAKISNNGEWQWAKGAGSSTTDTGEVITLSTDGNYGYISGQLRHDWGDSVLSVSGIGAGPGIRDDGCFPNNHVVPPRQNILGLNIGQYTYQVKSHAGMFESNHELKGCGAYIAKIKLSNGAWEDTFELSPPSREWFKVGLGTQAVTDYEPFTLCDYDCSDKYLSINGIFAAGSPERLYIIGNYASHLKLGDLEISTSGYEDVRGFMAKFEPITGEWVWLKNGCGNGANCYQIHDVTHNGVWHYFTSGCYYDQKFVAKYDFDGNEIWMKKFGAKCDFTEITIDDDGDLYVAGTYSENQNVINIGSIQLEHDKGIGHYIAHIDTNGNWIWAEDSHHNVTGFGGHKAYDTVWRPPSYQGNSIGDYERTDMTHVPYRSVWAYSGDYKAAKPTGLVVDSTSTVYVGGWLNGVGYFKNEQLVGISSYVAAISEPLQAPDEPIILVNPENNSIPNISFLSSILVAVGVATIWKPKKRE